MRICKIAHSETNLLAKEEEANFHRIKFISFVKECYPNVLINALVNWRVWRTRILAWPPSHRNEKVGEGKESWCFYLLLLLPRVVFCFHPLPLPPSCYPYPLQPHRSCKLCTFKSYLRSTVYAVLRRTPVSFFFSLFILSFKNLNVCRKRMLSLC